MNEWRHPIRLEGKCTPLCDSLYLTEGSSVAGRSRRLAPDARIPILLRGKILPSSIKSISEPAVPGTQNKDVRGGPEATVAD